jgi:hypothetical protein
LAGECATLVFGRPCACRRPAVQNRPKSWEGFQAGALYQGSAKRTGRSEAAVQQDMADATSLGDDVMKKIVGTSLDKPSEITALAAMDEQERQQKRPSFSFV